MNKIIVILGVVILIGIGGFMLLGNSQSNNQPARPEPIQNMESPTESVNDDSESTDSGKKSNVKEFTIVSKGLNFAPNEIKVNAGDTVRVTYKNTVGTHDWTIDEFNAKTKLLDAGQEETVEFVADKAGSFEFYCSVPGHRKAGMKGNLIVE
jgi:nitrite reductase (NO-forming)